MINLVSEKTIEHRMLGLLDAKRALADGVLDRLGDLSEIPMPTGRAAFMERLNAVLGGDRQGEAAAAAERQPHSPIEQLRDDLVARHGAALQRVLVGGDADQAEDQAAMLVVLDVSPARAAEEESRLAETAGMQVNVIDAASHEALLRLARNGVITMPGERMREIHPAPGAEQERAAAYAARARTLAGPRRAQAQGRRAAGRRWLRGGSAGAGDGGSAPRGRRPGGGARCAGAGRRRRGRGIPAG